MIEVDGQGHYVDGRCPAEARGCPGGPSPHRVICMRCEALGCGQCIVHDGDDYICDDCRASPPADCAD